MELWCHLVEEADRRRVRGYRIFLALGAGVAAMAILFYVVPIPGYSMLLWLAVAVIAERHFRYYRRLHRMEAVISLLDIRYRQGSEAVIDVIDLILPRVRLSSKLSDKFGVNLADDYGWFRLQYALALLNDVYCDTRAPADRFSGVKTRLDSYDCPNGPHHDATTSDETGVR